MKIRTALKSIPLTATALVLAGTLSACEALEPTESTESTGDSATTEETAALTCYDLSDKVWEYSPDENSGLLDTPAEDFNKLTQWMFDNGSSFEDADLGAAVTTYGELGGAYYNYANEIDFNAITPEEYDALEAASLLIDSECDGLGFGFEDTEAPE